MVAIPTLSAGGAERVVSVLCNHWALEGHQVSVVTLEAVSEAPFYVFEGGVQINRLDLPSIIGPKWRAIARTLERILALRRFIRHERPDIILSFLTKMNVMTLIAVSGLKIPVIISERNNPYLQKFDAFWNFARAITFPKAFAFVTMSKGASEYFPKRQRPRTRIIPNPVQPLHTAAKPHSGKVLVGVGRLTSQKRFDRLIEAFSMVADDFPDWRLVIWGEGSNRPSLENMRDRLNLKERISFPGLTKEHGAWVETADLLALTSDYEGWPNVLLEAMASGVPVVSVSCDFGPKEILADGEFGVLTQQNDLEALAKGLSTMMGDEAMRRTFAAKAKAASEAYAPSAIAALWGNVIEEALSANSR
ncbi:MAG: glycosyltransferase family 4 protein [Parvularculaceae bacterium]|nr:glycosyltransferase family 4 protein [Parvularculaceae bacterium]